jgi:hypothetical protein
MTDILDKLADLYKQATEERSHNYTGAVIKEAITHIAGLRAAVQIAARPTTEPQARCSAGSALADECDAWIRRNEAITLTEVSAKHLLSRAAAALRTLNEPQTSPTREEIARVVCCPGGCILVDTEDGCIACHPEFPESFSTADTILALTRPHSESGK